MRTLKVASFVLLAVCAARAQCTLVFNPVAGKLQCGGSGGSSLPTGTNGGVLAYYSGSYASSGLLSAGNFVLGGGASAPPTDAGVGPSAFAYLNPGSGSNTFTAGIENLFQPSATTAGVRFVCGTNPTGPHPGNLNCDGSGNPNWYTGSLWFAWTGASGKLFTFNNSITLAGTDGTTWTGPGTSFSVARIDAAQTFTGAQTFSTPVAVGSGGLGIASGTSGGVPCYTATTTIASSVLLTANFPMVGGGAGACPTVLNPNYTALTDGTTVTWAIGSAVSASADLTFTVHSGARTLNITNPVNGAQYVLWIKQDGTGGEGLTLGTGCTWKVSGGGAGAITPSTGANAVDILAFTYDGTNCYANFNKNFT